MRKTVSVKYKISDLQKWADEKKECNHPSGCSEKIVYHADSYIEIVVINQKHDVRAVKEIRCPKHGIVQYKFGL